MVELLLQKGAEIEATDKVRAFFLSSDSPSLSLYLDSSLHFLALLISAPGTIQAGLTALMYACRCYGDQVKVIELLLQKGAEIEATDNVRAFFLSFFRLSFP